MADGFDACDAVTPRPCGSMEAVLESINQLQELHSELFFSKLWKDIQSKIADSENVLQAITLPRHVHVKTPSRYRCVTQQQGSRTAPPVFQTAEDYYRVIACIYLSMMKLSILLADFSSQD